MKKKICARIYRIIRWVYRKTNPAFELSGTENLPEESAVLVGNHAQMYGPIGLGLYAPRPQYAWCTAEMMNLKEVPAYAFEPDRTATYGRLRHRHLSGGEGAAE